MDILNQNIAVIKQMGGDFYQEVFQNAPAYPDVEAIWTERGIQGRVNGQICYINSIYDQEKEYEWNLSHVSSDTEYLVFCGRATADLIRYMRKKLKKLIAVFFIEPTNQLFRASLEREQLLAMAKAAGRIHLNFFCNLSCQVTVKSICEIASYGNITEVVISPSYQNLFKTYCHTFMASYLEQTRFHAANNITDMTFRSMFLNNTLKNYCQPTVSGTMLKPLLSGKPAIIVGAGPSLKKNGHLLKEFKGKASLWACGSSIPTLDQWKIRTDFNVVYDPSDDSYFTKSDTFQKIPLIFGNQANFNSVNSYQGPKFNILTNTDNCTLYYFNQDQEDLVVKSGPSVVNIALDFLCKVGCSPIIFVGQDMCFYENQLHAIDEKHITGKEDEVTYNGKFKVKDIDGNDVETIVNYWVIKESIEVIITEYPQLKFINATEGGLGITGAEPMALESVLKNIADQGEDLSVGIDSILARDTAYRPARIEALESIGFTRDLEKTFQFAKKIMAYVDELEQLKEAGMNRSKVKQLITRIEKQSEKLKESEFYIKVITPYLGTQIKFIETRYQKDLLSNQIAKKINAIIEKNGRVMQNLIAFYFTVKKMYTEALTEYEEANKNVRELKA